ncbi:SUF system Fe-S cluster assembly regulator [Allohahella sp. A8]|uniref:SUF system Fe-S cluster assembly regulator n=1 Tax=Allohahella sp. A8 TaxID=3141461 RepID=UPI003A7F9007
MRLAKLADYGLVIAATLSRAETARAAEDRLTGGSTEKLTELVKLEWVAEQTSLTVATTRKIMKLLVDGGIVVSERGMRGGYRLAAPPDQISLADVLSAVEGEVALTDCCSDSRQCEVISNCNVQRNWSVINGTVNSLFSAISLKDMSGQLTREDVVARVQNDQTAPGRIAMVQLAR